MNPFSSISKWGTIDIFKDDGIERLTSYFQGFIYVSVLTHFILAISQHTVGPGRVDRRLEQAFHQI